MADLNIAPKEELEEVHSFINHTMPVGMMIRIPTFMSILNDSIADWETDREVFGDVSK